MKKKTDIIIKINNLKDWLYIMDGAYKKRCEWRIDLIKSINSIKKDVKELIQEEIK